MRGTRLSAATSSVLGPTNVPAHFLEQAQWCEELGSPFTAQLLRRFAVDFDGGGPIAQLCWNWPGNPRKDALGLRLCGALHYAVLTGTAPELAMLYPSATTAWDMSALWPRIRGWLASHLTFVASFLERPPQTNETRRSIILLPGFLKLAAHFNQPLHLLELGASAGLNQNWDRFNYTTSSWQRTGDSDVTIQTDWHGPAPPNQAQRVEIASRAACDLTPIDVNDPDARNRLRAYTWPDQADRMARLDAAIALARETDVRVEQADAAEWLEHKLRQRPTHGVTVIFHSVFLIYPPREQIARIMHSIEAAGAAATPQAPVAWLCYESEALFGGNKQSPKMLARLQVWPGETTQVYAQSDGHVTSVEMQTGSG